MFDILLFQFIHILVFVFKSLHHLKTCKITLNYMEFFLRQGRLLKLLNSQNTAKGEHLAYTKLINELYVENLAYVVII